MESKYCYQPAGHIITGDLKIISDSRIQSILCKGTRYRFSSLISTNAVKKLLVPYKKFVFDGASEVTLNLIL